MSCCQEKRARWWEQAASGYGKQPPAQAQPVTTVAAAPVEKSRPALRFLGKGGLSLRGPHTGRVYQFADGGDSTPVHPDDLDALLRTRLFARMDLQAKNAGK